MPGFLLRVDASAICPHGGQITSITTNTRVLVSRQPVVTQTDTFTVTGCAFTVGNKPQPCVMVKWMVPATRIMVNGKPVLLHNSVGICQSAEQIPQGPPNVVSTQMRVKGA